MNKTSLMGILIAGLLTLTACGGGDDAPTPAPAPAPPPPPPAGTVIGTAGGTVTGPNGTSVVIPAGALSNDTTILIEQSDAGAPAAPGGVSAGGQMFTFTPHGTTFAVPVTVTLPFDPALIPTGHVPSFYKTNAQNQWERIANAQFGATSVTAQVTSFSRIIVFEDELVLGRPVYQYEVHELKGDSLVQQSFVEAISIERGLADHYDFGPAHRDAEVYSFDGSLVVPSDERATAQFAATADGGDWWVGAEAPLGITGTETNTIGLLAEFKQTQSFIKREPDAVLSFFVTDAFVQTSDANISVQRGCAPAHTLGDICDAVSALVDLEVTAFTVPAGPFTNFDIFYRIAGSVEIIGIAGNWATGANTAGHSRVPLWDIGHFTIDVEKVQEQDLALITMKLTSPVFHEYFIDLSSVEVGQAFTVQSSGIAKAYNRAASRVNNRGPEFETSARAYLRDPRTPQGMEIFSRGLDPIETVAPEELPPDAPVDPAPCVPGPAPDPAAGTIQFDAPSYTQLESNTSSSITVTRTGGSTGAITATFATSDGSAVAGTDYEGLNNSVFFADGDSTPRVVTINFIANTASDEPDKTINLRLSEPGGCGALGSQTTAVLTIQDDDEPPPPPSFSVGGTVTGLEGTGLTLRDQQFLTLTPDNGPFTLSLPVESGSPYEVTITAQPTNPVQVCTIANGSGTMGNANVTNIRVSCETPSTPGGLDPGFGGGTGIVSSDFGGDETDMLLQSDGKIVMIGGSGTDFIMARFDTDGTVDESFGDSGLVTTDIAGGLDAAFGAALLEDGRILVVGSARVGSNDDFAIVRYESNGSVDVSFGTDGKTTSDFFGARDRAFGVAVLPDDSFVVVGDVQTAIGGRTDFGIARFNANGAIDTSFGGDGTGRRNTDIAGGADIAKNVVIENGGTILVTGTTTLGSSSTLGNTGLARYTAAGVLDNSLGTNGTVSIPFESLGEGLALQSDGRILLAGIVGVNGDSVFGLKRLDTNGSADSSFGSSGLATAGFSTQDDYGRDVAIDAEGRILVSGQTSNLSNPDFAVARFTSAGVLDNSFDDDGKFTVDFFDASDSAENVAVQTDGKIVLGGFGANGTALRYGLARITP